MKVKVETGRDNSSCKTPQPMGKKLGGSTTNVAHSLKGASVPDGTDKD